MDKDLKLVLVQNKHTAELYDFTSVSGILQLWSG